MKQATDTVVFDIETSNFFTSPEVGWGNFEAIDISVVGVYSYDRDEYACFEASDKSALKEWFTNAKTIVGFASNRYDTPILNLYFKKLGAEAGGALDLWRKDRVDLLEEIELGTGRRIGLSKLSEANLGEGKSGHGSEAITLFEQGRIEELKSYCLKDVELTKRLYDQFKEKRFFYIPDRDTNELVLVKFDAPSLQLPLF